jgi:outer membrane protein OmpA-like peptidoglycan-associated protein
MKRIVVMLALVALATGGIGCTRTQKGGAIGGSAGAVIGGIIGKQSGHTATGAIIGAAVGGAAGAAIGHYMDDQKEELDQELKGAKIERVGEGIKITFDSGILFDVAKSDLRPAAQTNLQSLATVLNKYPDTNVLIEGHTDADGTEDYNLDLSKRRAQSVANYLSGLQVDATRVTTMGYGEAQPVASNESAEGKQQNRRVEIAIMANEELKKKAEKGQLG